LKREKRRKRFEVSEVFFGVWNEQCELSIYRENSQLIYEKLWEQITHILDLVQKNLKLSTEIYHIEYKSIIYYVPKYISDQGPKYNRLDIKIFFCETWGQRKHFLIMIKLII
jgi:hypothetical protein